MGFTVQVDSDPVPLEMSSRSFSGKGFEDEAFSSDNFMEAQPGPIISLKYSIENGFEETEYDDNQSSSSTEYKCLSTNPSWRQRFKWIFIGVVLFLFITTLASVTSKQPPPSDDTTTEGNELRFKSKASEEGYGGAANQIFFQTQNENVFVGEDVKIPPLSILDPVNDLGRYGYDRPESSSPSGRLDPLVNGKKKALPTNAWYQNMLRLATDEDPTKNHRVYTVPYMIDAAGDFAGVRAHATRIEATSTQVRVAIDEPYALTLGAMSDFTDTFPNNSLDKGYTIHEANDLGLTLKWDSFMKTTLVRGSPYITMVYNMMDPLLSEGILPTMHWRLDTSEPPIADGLRLLDCASNPIFTVQRDLELAFRNSGQRWLLFFSQPVTLQCRDTLGTPTILQVLNGSDEDFEDQILVIRGALVVPSATATDDDEVFAKAYATQLRESASVYPGEKTTVGHSFSPGNDSARISFEWNAQTMRSGTNQIISRSTSEMIMFALPHHREVLVGNVFPTLCTSSLLGPICLVKGNVWNMYEGLPAVDFQAPRHPDPKYIPLLAQALMEDIQYEIPTNFQSGASDTYFSGKTMAKLARILLITEEVKDLCFLSSYDPRFDEYFEACDDLELPSEEEVDYALNQLRDAVTVWVKTNPEAPFLYDNAWGGLVSCGCLYADETCTNNFPDCPAFTDQGLNFGNGFYNDHHFHYGYHVYAAAVLAHFDASWAIDHYEDVALLIRDYANPSVEDESFPLFRNKDWYRGHSWASGLTDPMFGNIMNQESSSEAVMAYEAVALFGKTMASIFENVGDVEKTYVATMMHKIGLTLTATEIRSTQTYWQIQQTAAGGKRTFPESYTPSVVGILWETFAEFTTWFGNAPYLIYGIQLLPLTAIAEMRDNIEWAREISGPLATSCNLACISEGWSIQVNAVLATIGRVQEAIEGIARIPSNAYEHAGGNGHSKSNTLWYVTTRPTSSDREEELTPPPTINQIPSFNNENDMTFRPEIVTTSPPNTDGDSQITGSGDEGASDDDFEENVFVDDDGDDADKTVDSTGSNVFDAISTESDDYDGPSGEELELGLTCFDSSKCTSDTLDRDAAGHSCRDRMQYLMDVLGKSEFDACQQVAVNEYPTECGDCQPGTP